MIYFQLEVKKTRIFKILSWGINKPLKSLGAETSIDMFSTWGGVCVNIFSRSI